MQTQATEATPLACVPDAIAAEERPAHVALVRRLFDELAEAREEVANGYAFRFPAEALDAVGRFVANERKCCPFLTLVVEVTPDAGPVWLRLTGPEGTRGLLDAEILDR